MGGTFQVFLGTISVLRKQNYTRRTRVYVCVAAYDTQNKLAVFLFSFQILKIDFYLFIVTCNYMHTCLRTHIHACINYTHKHGLQLNLIETSMEVYMRIKLQVSVVSKFNKNPSWKNACEAKLHHMPLIIYVQIQCSKQMLGQVNALQGLYKE